MAGRKFLWVGGLTGTTSAERFNFNVANNWLLTNDNPTSKTARWRSSSVVPGPNDSVWIGCSEIYTPTSPLLFGGFSAEATGGNWFGTYYTNLGISGYQGGSTLNDSTGNIYSGTTFTSHLSSFSIVGPFNSPTDLGRSLFSYPFPVVGGGLTGDSIELLKGCDVVGMDITSWDALVANCTTKQSKLVIKSDIVSINGDYARSLGGITWNSYTQTTSWQFGQPTQRRHVYLELADNISSSTSSPPNTIKTNVSVNATAVKLFLTNSKVIDIRIGIGESLRKVFSPYYIPELILKNCVVLNIGNDTVPFVLKTAYDCLVGSVNLYVDQWWRTRFYTYSGMQNEELIGLTWNPSTPMNELSGIFSSKRAYQQLNPGSTLGFDYVNFNYDTSGVTQPMIFQFGSRWFDEDSRRTLGSTFSVYEGAFSGTPNYDDRLRTTYPPSNTCSVSFLAGGKIDKLVASGVRLQGINLNPSDIVSIMNCEMENNSYFDFTASYGFKNWRFGFISGTTYSGGLVFTDTSNNMIRGDPGIRFLNYGVYGKTVNTRNNVVFDLATSAPQAEAQ